MDWGDRACERSRIIVPSESLLELPDSGGVAFGPTRATTRWSCCRTAAERCSDLACREVERGRGCD